MGAMTDAAGLNVQLLLTGDELMTGDIVDSNSVMIADALMPLGLVLSRKVVVGDKLSVLVKEIEGVTKQADVLIVNGGLGPTIDDLTAEALAQVLDVPLEEHAVAMAQLSAWCERRNYPLNGPNKKQARLPKGVGIIENPVGSAPGFKMIHNGCLIMCTPGVPIELDAMLTSGIVPQLKGMCDHAFTQIKKYQVFGMGEAPLQKIIEESYPDWPQEIELGFRAAFPILDVKLTARSQAGIDLLPVWQTKIESTLGAHSLGEVTDEESTGMAQHVVTLLAEKNQTLTTAESCTGGLIASKITSVSGSSNVFEAGIVSYSNAIKHKVLGVSQETLKQHGAVSEEVVLQMAAGALDISGADYGVAVSGIAGPGGGSEDKPVGTCWLAWGTKASLKAVKLFYPSNRAYFQDYIATAALDVIRRDILEVKETPRYFSNKKPS